MPSISGTNKRIAKNTLYLYIRMLFVLIVSLYTSRVVLKTLGVTDFGITNVVGGIVTMFVFLSGLISSATSRYFTFEIGRNNTEKVKQYFSISVICYVVIAFIIFILCETIGVWFLNHKLIIPEERMLAAMWVLQFAILSFAIRLMISPMEAMIIAKEEMNYFAIIGIGETILKLLIVFILVALPFDKLISYSALLFFVTVLVAFAYFIFCKSKIPECSFKLRWNAYMFKELISFSAWSMIGSLASAFRSQGINILLNMFFAPAVNAARGIAYQVNGAIDQFVSNFYKAVQPQVIKQYAADNNDNMMSLVFRSSRFCFYLILILSIPVLLETPFLLRVWLSEVPDYTILFTRIVIYTAIIDSISYPCMTAIHATGNIKYLQSIVGTLLILTLPIAYLFLKLGYPPQSTMYVALGISVLAQTTRIILMKHQLSMSIASYLKEVLLYLLIVSILSIPIPLILHRYIINPFVRLVVVAIGSVVWCGLIIYFVGLKKNERYFIDNIVKNKLHIPSSRSNKNNI